MRKYLALTAAAFVALATLPAAAQVPGGQPGRINLTVEQRHVIKEIIKDLKIGSAPAGADSTVGAAVPPDVTLQPMPNDVTAKVPQIRSHRFFVKDGRVVLVDPKDNKVVEVID